MIVNRDDAYYYHCMAMLLLLSMHYVLFLCDISPSQAIQLNWMTCTWAGWHNYSIMVVHASRILRPPWRNGL